MEIKKITILFLLLSTLASCGFKSGSQNNSYLLNKEETNERDVSKSKKTTEKFSESLEQKSDHVPQNLLKGFRKSGISNKIKVQDGPNIKETPTVTLEKQEEVDNQLVKAVLDNKFSDVESLLNHGADPQKAMNEWVETPNPQTEARIIALLHFQGAEVTDGYLDDLLTQLDSNDVMQKFSDINRSLELRDILSRSNEVAQEAIRLTTKAVFDTLSKTKEELKHKTLIAIAVRQEARLENLLQNKLETPEYYLYEAVLNDDLWAVWLLLKLGADPFVSEGKRISAYKLANKMKLDDILYEFKKLKK